MSLRYVSPIDELALRLVGTNPNTVMPNHGAGIDWIRLTPVAAPPKPGKNE